MASSPRGGGGGSGVPHKQVPLKVPVGISRTMSVASQHSSSTQRGRRHSHDDESLNGSDNGSAEGTVAETSPKPSSSSSPNSKATKAKAVAEQKSMQWEEMGSAQRAGAGTRASPRKRK